MAINDNDLLLINDSQDGNEAKKIKYSTLKSNINGDDGNDLQAVTDNGNTTTNGASFAGQMLIGTNSSRDQYNNTTGQAPKMQIETVAGEPSNTIGIVRNSVNDFPSIFVLAKSRGTTAGDATIVSDDDNIGTINFQGADGTNLVEAAAITAQVDGTPGANDMPGRLVFSTTADGASSPTERVRITSSGNMLLGGTLPSAPNILLDERGFAQFTRTDSSNNQAFKVSIGASNGAFTGLNGWGISVQANPGVSDKGAYISYLGEGYFSDSVKIGGTSAIPEISLNSNGSAKLTGNVELERFLQVNNKSNNNSDKVLISGSSQWGIQVDDGSSQTCQIGWDGSATFAGAVNVPDSIANGDGVNLNPYGNIAIRRDDTTQSAFQISKGAGNNNRTIRMLSEGSATFASTASSPSTNHTIAAFNSTISSDSTSTYFAQNTAGGRIWKGSDGSETSTIWADGRAQFAATGVFGTLNYNSSHALVAQNKGSDVQSTFVAVNTNSSVAPAIQVRDDNSLSDTKATIFNDGSATFGDSATDGGSNGVTLSPNGNVSVSRSTTGSALFSGYTTGNSNTTVRIQADGSAIFAGNVQTGTWNGSTGSGTTVGAGGTLACRPASDDSSNVLSVIPTDTSAVNIALRADGSATFAGDIDANNVTFDAGTADVINVRERLVEARERLEKARETFQELQVAVANSNDFSDLKAAMMVALEDYVDGGY